VAANEVVVGATRKVLQVQLIDPNTGNPLVFGAGTPKVALQGTSLDLPGVQINIYGNISNPPLAICQWLKAGDLVSSVNMAGRPDATFNCRVRVEDGASVVFDWAPKFDLLFSMPPAVTGTPAVAAT